MDKQSLARGSVVYGIGNIGTLAINFFLVPLYTFFLSKEELGFFDILASSIVVMTPFVFGHIELAIIRWLLANKDLENVRSVLSNSFLVFIVGLLFFTGAYVLAQYFVQWDYTFLVYVYLVCNFFNIIVKQVIRSVYSPMHYVGTELGYTLIVLACILLLIERFKLEAIFLAYLIASSALLGYILLLNIWKKIGVRAMKYSVIKELLSYSAPLIPNTFSLWLNNMSNKYLIVLFLGLSANGIYAIAFKFAYVLQILNRIFYFSFQDKMFLVYGKGDFKAYYSNTFNKYVVIMFSLWYLLTGSQRLVLPYIIDEDFHQAMNYIPILGLGVVFMSLASIIGIIYQCEKRNMDASKTSLISGILIVVLGVLAIPTYGIYGASVAFTIGNLILFFYRFFDTKRFIPINIGFNSIVLYFTVGVIVWLVSLVNDFKAYFLSFSIALGVTIYFNWKLVSRYLHRIKFK